MSAKGNTNTESDNASMHSKGWLRYPLVTLGFQAFKFLLVGLPAFVVAIPFNIFLVEYLHWLKWLAYALTLYLQVTVNFFFCRWFVFEPSKLKSAWRQYFEFLGVVAIFRTLDWGVYTLVVSTTSIHYIIVQCTNVVIFSLAKFMLSKRAIEGATKTVNTESLSNETDNSDTLSK